MSRQGPIVIVEDDLEDQEIIQAAIIETGILNNLVFFERCVDAYDFLKRSKEQPFIIFSDVNFPRMNGIEFKRKIDGDPELRGKSIPFVFFSTAVEKHNVDAAYKELTVPGFFKKSHLYEALVKELKIIFDYWSISYHPNS